MTERCPHCNSKSGVDIKGRDFCHACKKNFNKKERSIGKEILEGIEEIKNRTLRMPEEEYYTITEDEEKYLLKYNIQQGVNSIVFHSSLYNRLVFPYYDTYNMRGCWMRNISDNFRPKWLFAGEKYFSWHYLTLPKEPVSYIKEVYKIGTTDKYNDLLNICARTLNMSKICLVEDVISAIRVSKFMDVICLGGTYLSKYDKEVIQQYNQVVIFLDPDSAGREAAKKIRKELKLTMKCRIIRGTQDPKCYPDEELKEILNDSRA